MPQGLKPHLYWRFLAAGLKHFHYCDRVGFVVSHPFHKEREKDGARSFLRPSVKMP
jgi:hypothetical protein